MQDVRIVGNTPEHVFWLDAETLHWLADLIPANDLFRQELLDAAKTLDDLYRPPT